MRLPLLLALAAVSLLAPSAARAGRIIVNHDEWTTSNAGFAAAGGTNASTFVQNLAQFFLHGGSGGSFLVYSSDFSLNESDFSETLTNAGHSLTISTAVTFDLPTLLGYDAVFLAGLPGASASVLTDYVNAGGGVYLAGGTFLGGNATGEANAWNPFLNNFGLSFAGGSYNGIIGTVPVTGTHPVLNGVSNLYYGNGNTVHATGGSPHAQIIQSTGINGNGQLGLYDDTELQTVPEPATLSMLFLGLGATIIALRRRA